MGLQRKLFLHTTLLQSSMKHILMTLYNLKMGGIQTTAVTYINLFISQGWQVDVYLVDHKEGVLIEQLPKGVNLITPSKNLSSTYQRYRSVGESLLGITLHHKLIQKEARKNTTQYDLAMAFEGYHNHSDLYAAFVQAKVKSVWVHNDYIEANKTGMKKKILLKSMKKKYQYFDSIVCVSDSSKQSFIKLLPEYEDKTTVITNPFPYQTIITKSKSHNEYPHIIRDKNTFHIISIGNLLPRKGFDRLIKSFSEAIANTRQSAHLTIIGEGPEREKLESLIKKYNLEEKITLTGQLTNPFSTLKEADLFIMSSHYEGFPTVLLEALSLGISIATVNISGARDVIATFASESPSIGQVFDNSEVGLIKGISSGLEGNFSRNFSLDFEKYHKGIIQKLLTIIS